MSFFEILDSLLLKPIQLLFEVIYVMANRLTDNPGLSIIVLSLFVNFLVLPLYIRADKMQEEEQVVEKKLQKGVDHIKKTFSGDERMMILQTYYRQNNYKPIYILRSAVSLFLQIPFFIAAYRFLSGLQLLKGASLGLILDLSRPDEILIIDGMAFNILPVIMTAVNLVSCVIFTKGSPLKVKIQLYVMALFFLLFLYTSPSGLVFYWTLNNLFSLLKIFFYKLKNPGKVLGIFFSMSGVALVIFALLIVQTLSLRKAVSLIGIGVIMQIPFACAVLKKRRSKITKSIRKTESKRLFFTGVILLSLLTGGLIPSAVIKSSPLEFVDITYFYNPLWFIVSSSCLAIGAFVIWGGVFYLLTKSSTRIFFERSIWCISGIALVNYMFFGKKYGILMSNLKYENKLEIMGRDQVWNGIIVIAITGISYIIYRYWKKWVLEILAVSVFAISAMTVINIMDINNSVVSLKEQTAEDFGETPRFTLSKKGNNVIIVMLDRAMGLYIPYLFQEKPELKEQFSGFTYYANVVSFGPATHFGTPALFGGYEYTPVEINKRTEESLVSKQNEALKVMPVLFGQNGYDVIVCDPPYAGYQWIPDLSIYDEYPEIKSYITKGKFTDKSIKEYNILNDKRNFFCYSIFRTMPLCVQEIVYDYGRYNQVENGIEVVYSKQMMNGLSTSTGISTSFMDSYNVLTSLPYITDVVDNNVNTFLMLTNDITHEPMLLQEPGYTPAMEVNNLEYDKNHQDRFVVADHRLRMETDQQIISYQTNMAAMLCLGEWFNYMRRNNVYDNTRIILVSDHGCYLNHLDKLQLDNGYDISGYYPLLMVKDFNSEGFVISEEFMTNGDVPSIALESIIKDPINPFTGKVIDSSEKLIHEQYIVGWGNMEVLANKESQFLSVGWFAVHDDMRNPENWELIPEDIIFPTEE